MRTDVAELREFYRSPLGRIAARMIARRIRTFWPDARGLSIMGLGYAVPFLVPFRGEAERLVAAMPAAQGVVRWPRDEPNLVTLAEETELPFPDLSFDRVVLVHAVETSESLRPMMREIWRVLAESGRLAVVVPNRRGVWARVDTTPFGNGLPYSLGQLNRMLADTMFTPVQHARALYVPPVRSRMLVRAADALEEVGARCFTRFGGVVVAEAVKEIYAAAAQPAARKARAMRRPILLDGRAARHRHEEAGEKGGGEG